MSTNCHVSHLCQPKNVPPPFIRKPAGHMDMYSSITLPPANIIQGCYLYTADLLQLATVSSCSPYQTWLTYLSPIQLNLIAPFLASHPDQAFASYIHMGLLTGFRIGYSDDRALLCSCNANHPSAHGNKTVVDERIAAELAAGRLHDPIPSQLQPLVHTSPLGLVPKAHHSNKWCMIYDLSSPTGHSVNDGISPDLCSLHYASVDKCSGHHLEAGTRHTVGQAEHQGCLSHGTHSPCRLPPLGY